MSYQPDRGQAGCITCPDNKVTRRRGATDVTECVGKSAIIDDYVTKHLTTLSYKILTSSRRYVLRKDNVALFF